MSLSSLFLFAKRHEKTFGVSDQRAVQPKMARGLKIRI